MQVKSQMKGFIPKLLVPITALCFGGAIALEYHKDQIAANKVLAEKVGLPEAVALQSFNPEADVNAINEIHLMAEVQADQQVILNIGQDGVARWVHVMPLYAVSADAMPLVEAHQAEHSELPRRPKPRAEANLIAQQNFWSTAFQTQPLAFAIRYVPEGKLAGFKLGTVGDKFGSGSVGDLIEIKGARLSGEALSAQVENALVPYGVEVTSQALFVEPYDAGMESIYVVPDYSSLQSILVVMGAVLSLISLAFIFGILPWKKRETPKRPESVEAVGNFPSVDFFEPILSQEELAADQEAEKKRARIISRVA